MTSTGRECCCGQTCVLRPLWLDRTARTSTPSVWVTSGQLREQSYHYFIVLYGNGYGPSCSVVNVNRKHYWSPPTPEYIFQTSKRQFLQFSLLCIGWLSPVRRPAWYEGPDHRALQHLPGGRGGRHYQLSCCQNQGAHCWVRERLWSLTLGHFLVRK